MKRYQLGTVLDYLDEYVVAAVLALRPSASNDDVLLARQRRIDLRAYLEELLGSDAE